MNREEWQVHMDLAEMRVVEGLAQIEKQRRLIQDLEGNGGDATRAQAFLVTLLESQASYERHRDRLRQEAGMDLQSQEISAPLPTEASPELGNVADDPQDDGHGPAEGHAGDREPAGT